MKINLYENLPDMTLNFDPAAEYTLENDRVLLRTLKETDIEYFLPFALNEPDTWKYSITSPKGEEGMKTYIDQALKARAAGFEYAFIVFDKQTQEYAGCTRFYDIQVKNQALQLGYTWYGEKFRRTGLNRNCKFLLLQFAFEKLNALRVEFRADANNAKSIAAMKAIGCKPEGILRNHLPLPDGTRRSSIVLSILKEEWLGNVKDDLLKMIR